MKTPQLGYLKLKSKKHLRLDQVPVRLQSEPNSPQEYKKLLIANQERIEEFQTLLYANHRQAVLIIFQGMDTSGKDGAIKHVMSGVNPQGCSVVSFKTPTTTELDHDFLWRASCVLPARGQIGIFNRSYYEEALITRVHPQLLEKENLPKSPIQGDNFWKKRYHDIVHYEQYLHRQGYEIIKIFLHISKDEQKRRLLDRFSDPKKLWKLSEGDIRERRFWKEYQRDYEKCLPQTTSKHSPWYIVPGNDKEGARLCVSQILVDRFKKMGLSYPIFKPEAKRRLQKLKALLIQD